MNVQPRYPMIIGRSELIAFPDTDLAYVPSKIDTGAYRSSIHAANIHVVHDKAGDTLMFDLLAGHVASPGAVHMETKEFSIIADVKNSFGHKEDRYAIKLKVKIGPKVFVTSFTLADRSNNYYPVLIGRTFLRRRFLVDVQKSGIDRTLLMERYNIQVPDDEELQILGEV